MVIDNIALSLVKSAVTYFSMEGTEKKLFYDKHIQKNIVIPFVYNQLEEKYMNIITGDKHYCLANFTFLVSCVYFEYKTILLDYEEELVLSSIQSFSDIINSYIFDDKNIIDDVYIVNNHGYFLDIRQQAIKLLKVIGILEVQPCLLNISEIIGIYNYVTSPEAWSVL